MITVNVHDAKTRLSQLLAAIEQGEEVVIARNGTPVARLISYEARVQLEAGTWRKLPGWENFEFDPSVLAPLETDEELAAEG